jgi:aminotransferase
VLAGGTPVIINLKAENEFRLTAQELEDAITPKTKILVLPFPNNPTGAVMEKKDLEAIAKVVIEHDLFVLSDEIYSELTYLEHHVSIASLPGMKERTIVINGFSKSHAMTGWRLGYACGPELIIKQMLKIHQYAIMCAPTTSQYAAVDALKNGDDDVAMMREEYNGRRRYLLHRFKEMGLDCFEPYGAFYMFPCIKEFGMTSEEFATRLLQEEKVAVVPGTAFGECGEGFLRISYAYSLKNLKNALERIERFITKLRAEAK